MGASPRRSEWVEHGFRFVTHALLGLIIWLAQSMYGDLKRLRCAISDLNTRLTVIETKINHRK